MVLITQLFSWIIFINDCICILTGSPGWYFFNIVYVVQKLGVTIILQFSQPNGKLLLSQWKQVNHPVIYIYGGDRMWNLISSWIFYARMSMLMIQWYPSTDNKVNSFWCLMFNVKYTASIVYLTISIVVGILYSKYISDV